MRQVYDHGSHTGNDHYELFQAVRDLGTKLVAELRTAGDVKLSVDFRVSVKGANAAALTDEVRRLLDEMGLGPSLEIERE